jgi:hypothetical protein
MNAAYNVLGVIEMLRGLFGVPLIAASRLAKPPKRSSSPAQPICFLDDCSDCHRVERTSSPQDLRTMWSSAFHGALEARIRLTFQLDPELAPAI